MLPSSRKITVTINIDIISDVICPWCYIGKRRLETAIAQSGRTDLAVRWHPFQLNPQLPKAGIDRRDYRTAKFGSWERSQARDAQVAAAGQAEGLTFAFDRQALTPNTLDAHRLIWLAGQHGIQDAVVEALFHAYFTDGQNLGDPTVLLNIVTTAGLDRGRAQQLLGSDTGLPEIHAAETQARQLGVQSVPFFVINGAVGLSGARAPEEFLAAFEQAATTQTAGEGACNISEDGAKAC